MNLGREFVLRLEAFSGLAVAVLTYIFGPHWILFLGYFVLNITDVITGINAARLNHRESSEAGYKGAVKKFSCWIMIFLGFGLSVIFIEIGKVINVDLHITALLGWFIIGMLIMNEARSIVENLVESDIWVPEVLKNGLKIADKVLDKADDIFNVEDEEDISG